MEFYLAIFYFYDTQIFQERLETNGYSLVYRMLEIESVFEQHNFGVHAQCHRVLSLHNVGACSSSRVCRAHRSRLSSGHSDDQVIAIGVADMAPIDTTRATDVSEEQQRQRLRQYRG